MSAKRAKKPERDRPADLSLPLEALRWPVLREHDGERIDRYLLLRLTWRSRTSIVQLLEDGKVRRNGELVRKKAVRVREGDEVSVDVPPPEEEARHEQLGLELMACIIHDDEHMLAVAKPAGLIMHPVGRVRVNTLIQGLHWAYVHGPLAKAGTPPDSLPRICHRLDRDTSGVVVLAKTPAARTALQHAFDVHDLEKDYLAVVAGRVDVDEGRIDAPIGSDSESGIGVKMTTRPDGAPSLTTFRVLERFAGASVLRFRIHTGRQHQIRVHAQALGHPVFLDPLYGTGATEWPPGEDPVIARQALHAERLALSHPISGSTLELSAPRPADLEALLAGLRTSEG